MKKINALTIAIMFIASTVNAQQNWNNIWKDILFDDNKSIVYFIDLPEAETKTYIGTNKELIKDLPNNVPIKMYIKTFYDTIPINYYLKQGDIGCVGNLIFVKQDQHRYYYKETIKKGICTNGGIVVLEAFNPSEESIGIPPRQLSYLWYYPSSGIIGGATILTEKYQRDYTY